MPPRSQVHPVELGAAIAVLLASAALGAFIGWLVGASDTPVVAALIPLVFGLTGVLWQRYTSLRQRVDTALTVEQRAGAERAMDVVRGASDTPPESPWASTLLTAFVVMTFVAGAYWGVQRGIDTRVPQLPLLAELIAEDSTLDFREAATLTRLRLDLAGMRLSPGEVREVFRSSVLPVLQRKEFRPGGALHDIRPDALRDVARQLTVATSLAPQQRGRNPASDTPARPEPADSEPAPRGEQRR